MTGLHESERNNYAALFRVGGSVESRFVSEDEEAEESSLSEAGVLAEKQKVEPSYLSLRGLTRTYATILYRELDVSLNPVTNSTADILGLARMDESELASIIREPIHVRSSVESDVDILLEESEPAAGRFDIEIRRGVGLEERSKFFNENVQNVFNAIMQKVNLAESTKAMQEIIEGKDTDVSGNVSLRRLMASNRLAKIPEIERQRKREPEQYYEDLLEIRLLTTILGIEEVDEINAPELIDFWRSRSRSHANVIELFLYMVERKRLVSGAERLHYHYSADSMIRYGLKQDKPDTLHEEVTRSAKSILSTSLRMKSDRVDLFFNPEDSQLNQLKMLYIAWISSYPDLVDVRRHAKSIFSRKFETNHDRIKAMQEIYRVAQKNLEDEAERHQRATTSDSWDSFGVIDYDLGIPDELDEYNKKLIFYRTAWLLGKYLFTAEKIDEAISHAGKVFI
ncbi:MAG: hypothetical protein ACREGG_02895 [Candidatus Saccharimonadales bacterium]